MDIKKINSEKDLVKVLDSKVIDMDLSIRLILALKNTGIITLNQIVVNSLDFYKENKFGKKIILEMEQFLESKGLYLGMDPNLTYESYVSKFQTANSEIKLNDFINVDNVSKLKEIKTIQTHNGQFHADEVLAIAILTIVCEKDFDIERIDRSLKDLKSGTIVLDIGKTYEPNNFRFDHHHDANVESTNVLVSKFVFNDEFYEDIRPFMELVSEIDRGIKYNVDHPTGINVNIRNLNGEKDGFKNALSYAIITLKGLFSTSLKSIKGKSVYENMKRHKNLRYNDKVQDIIPNWQLIAKKEGVEFLVMVNPKDEGFILANNGLVIPRSDKEVFYHPNGFFCTYPSFEDALEHAKTF